MNLTQQKLKNIPIDSVLANNFTLKAGSKLLFEESNLKITQGQKYGLIGKNGCGKSSLLRQIADRKFKIHPNILILYVEQEIEDTDESPVKIILKSNRRMNEISKRIAEIELLLESDDANEEIFEEYENLQQEIKSFEPEKQKPKIKKILKGLGFSDKKMELPCNNFSGGWKMRISLAKALYIEPDLLLLDEPTNHLDLEAVIWLSEYLENLKSMALIVSHNVGFLNKVCNNILNIENFKLVNYRGNYSAFKKNFYNKQKTALKDWNKYEKNLKKFKKKASSKNEIAEFITKNQVPKPEKDYNLQIKIPETAIYNGNIIQLNNVSFSYDDDNQIFDNIDFGLDMESVVTLVGKNGSGKSTLLKLIMGELEPSSGNIWRQNGMRIGYYNQHFENTLPLDQSPVEYLESIFPEKLQSVNKIHTIRGYLGQMRLEGKAHVQKIGELSGGQKARVAMVKLIFTLPHFILLDEPTNHLDLETIEALIDGLRNYNGGIMVITHEEELITQLDSQLWVLENKKINFYRNSFEDYCDEIINL